MNPINLFLLPRRPRASTLLKVALRRIGAVLVLLVGLAVLHEVVPQVVDSTAAETAASALADGEV